MVTNLQKGNSFYKKKDYQNALIKYCQASLDFPDLSRLLAFNIFLSKNRLKLDNPNNKILDFLQDPSYSHPESFDFNPSIIFDYQFYLESNPDVRESGIDPQVHYYECGEAENRWPNHFFDPGFYKSRYSDLQAYNNSLFEHYIRIGIHEKRQIRDIDLKKSAFKNKRTLLLVTHDTDVGGAQQVLKLFARWIKESTAYDVQIISIKSGNLRHSFEEIAPCFVLSDIQPEDRASAIKAWMNHDIAAVFINSIASVEVLNYISPDIPAISFIHEMPQILEKYQDSIELLRNNNVRILTGGPEVGKAFIDEYQFDSTRIFNCVSFIEPLPKVDLDLRYSQARQSLAILNNRFLIFGCGVLHWRKSPKTFIEVAEHVLSLYDNVDFVWLGGGPDQESCEEMVRNKGLEKRITFTGYEPNVADKLAGGNLFLLTSEEDPFPLVALYAAQAGMPIVCFKDAGGIEGFVNMGGGIATPLMNVEKMANAVINYIKNPLICKHDGDQGRKQVSRSHTVNVVAPILMHHIRDVAKLKPAVSVVVPNFNYESYLIERLDSISNQIFQDFEVILLDDCSLDNSIDILKDFVTGRPGTQLVVNHKNSGSPFVQWIRGMRLANSELIWLAEADDRCTPDFLEKMLPMFGDRNVFIASCGSRPITSDGDVIGDYRELYLNRICPGRWDQDYIATDHDEINCGLGIANSIPNASAVIFRKFLPDPLFESEVTSMRLCGDWYFYLRAMQGGYLGYKCLVMNDHRRHGNTVTHNLEGSIRYFDELATVRSYISRTFRQSPSASTKVQAFLKQDIDRFQISDIHDWPQACVAQKTLPTLLIVAPDFAPGGGQVFAITLANEWISRGGRCLLLNVSNQISHPEVLKLISDRVIYFDLKVDACDLSSLINDFDIDVIHSCIWWADCWVDDSRDDLPIDMPWIITMHGCHETILHNPSIDPTFCQRMDRMIKRAKWVHTAQKNLEVFETVGFPLHLCRIGNGTKDQTLVTQLSRSDLGLSHDSLVLCLASRAIDTKGWFEAVRLVDRLVKEGRNIELLLIGEGPAADTICSLSPQNVFLVGQVSNLHDYLSVCDIGILPSYFPGESFPLILLEMMCNSLPIIASDIGDIPSMIGEGSDAAGIIIPRTESGINEKSLYDAAITLSNYKIRLDFAKASRARYQTYYSIERMVDSYLPLYTKELLD